MPIATAPTVRAVQGFTFDDFPLENRASLLTADGARAQCTLHYTDGNNDWSDSAILRFSVPRARLKDRLIDFSYTIKGCRITDNGGVTRTGVFEVSLIANGGFQRVGVAERMTVNGADWADPTIATDFTNTKINKRYQAPGNRTMFCGGANNQFRGINGSYAGDRTQFIMQDPPTYGAGTGFHVGKRMGTFEDIAGLTFRVLAEPTSGVDYTIAADTIILVAYGTPAPAENAQCKPCTINTLSVSDFETARAEAPFGAVECDWASITNAAREDTTIATCGVGDCSTMLTPPPGSTATDTLGVTLPVRMDIAPGGLPDASTTDLEFRLAILCRVEAATQGDTIPDFAQIEGITILDADEGPILDSTNVKYDDLTIKIGSQGWYPSPANATTFRRGERWREMVVDGSSLTAAQRRDLNARGFSMFIWFRLGNLINPDENEETRFCAIAINCFRPYTCGTPAARIRNASGDGGRLGRLGR